MQQILNTLFVMTPNSYLHLENNTLRVDIEKEKKLQVPLLHIGTIVCFGDVMISPAAMHRCAEEGKSIVLLDRNGRFKARVEGPISGNVLLRKAQYQATQDSKTCLEFAQTFVAGKIKNSRQVLLRGARESNNDDVKNSLNNQIENLANSIKSIRSTTNLDVLRGLEGEAAKNYFSCLTLLLRTDAQEAFSMNGRNKRPPLDRFNALISFIYALLMNDCRSALESVGLDPQMGFLHALRPGRAALALDLIEEFRSVIADRLAITLINRVQLSEKDFVDRPGGGIYLNDTGKKTVVAAYQNRKQEEITHPLLEQKMQLGLLPHIQARLLARAIRGEMEGYVPYLNK